LHEWPWDELISGGLKVERELQTYQEERTQQRWQIPKWEIARELTVERKRKRERKTQWLVVGLVEPMERKEEAGRMAAWKLEKEILLVRSQRDMEIGIQ